VNLRSFGPRACTEEEVAGALKDLDGAPHRIRARDWPGDLTAMDQAGLYSWWVDGPGAHDLSAGLEIDLPAGRIYAGEAGATRWPSGTPSTATLRSRIESQHVGGNVYGSTFRLTLASILRPALGLVAAGRKKLADGGEERLSDWIRDHLIVAVHPYPNRDALEDLEHRVLGHLDPPLNLRGMRITPARTRLSVLRGLLAPTPGGIPASRASVPKLRKEVTVSQPGSVHPRVRLHEEMSAILRERGNPWMSRRELADFVNTRGRYHKHDGSAVTDFQIHGRARQYPNLFDRQGTRIRLREGAP